HVPVIRSPAALWRNPINNLVGIHNVTGFAMDAVGEINLQSSATPGLLYHLVDIRRAEAFARVPVFPGTPVHTNVCVGNLQVARLILRMFGPRIVDVSHLIERELAVEFQARIPVTFEERDALHMLVAGVDRKPFGQSAAGNRRYAGHKHPKGSATVESLMEIPGLEKLSADRALPDFAVVASELL